MTKTGLILLTKDEYNSNTSNSLLIIVLSIISLYLNSSLSSLKKWNRDNTNNTLLV